MNEKLAALLAELTATQTFTKVVNDLNATTGPVDVEALSERVAARLVQAVEDARAELHRAVDAAVNQAPRV